MKYMILIYADESRFANLSPDAAAAVYAAHGKYNEDLQAAGVLRGGAELAPASSATTVRIRNGAPVFTDGPFAETKEQLGGYYLIEAANLDEALKWAARCPGAEYGAIEVRPQTQNEAGGPCHA